MGKLILNSKGLNTKIGCKQILENIDDKDISNSSMFIISYPPYGVDDIIMNNAVEIMGFQRENLYLSANGVPKGIIPDYVYVTEGNTFEVLKYMRDNLFMDYIENLVQSENRTYIGSSAGAIIAGTDIMLARDFDSNFVRMIDFTALGLFDGTIIPHYEPENLELYIQNTEKHILNRYLRILSVSNHDVVVIEDGKVMR